MRRPQFLMRRQDGYQRPQTFYRSFVRQCPSMMHGGDSSNIYVHAHIAQVDGCYGLLCELGINGLINSMSRMINNYWNNLLWLTPHPPRSSSSCQSWGNLWNQTCKLVHWKLEFNCSVNSPLRLRIKDKVDISCVILVWKVGRWQHKSRESFFGRPYWQCNQGRPMPIV